MTTIPPVSTAGLPHWHTGQFDASRARCLCWWSWVCIMDCKSLISACCQNKAIVRHTMISTGATCGCICTRLSHCFNFLNCYYVGLVQFCDLPSGSVQQCNPAVTRSNPTTFHPILVAMAWYEQLDLDFGNITDQFTDLIGEVSSFCDQILSTRHTDKLLLIFRRPHCWKMQTTWRFLTWTQWLSRKNWKRN